MPGNRRGVGRWLVQAPLLAALVSGLPLCAAFGTFVPLQTISKGGTRVTYGTSPLIVSMISWDDFAFDAQNAANNMASTSLQGDPSNLLSSIPVMYGAGLLTSISPCVWGLLPLTISYISNAAGERKDKATTLPTLAFAAGLASVFGCIG